MLTVARKKDYKAVMPSVTKRFEAVDDAIRIDLPRNPRNHRQIDHSQYLGLGFDAWAVQSMYVIRALLQSGNLSVSTLISYSVNGLRFFFSFLRSGVLTAPPLTPNNLTRRDVERYISWLKIKYPNGLTAKNYYTSLKRC